MRRLALLLVVTLALPSCRIAVPRVVDPPAPTTTAASLDLADPDLQRRLGAAPPDEVDWQRTVGGVPVLGVGTRPDPAELQLIGGAIEEVPPRLESRIPAVTLVRTRQVEGAELHEEAAAYARGTTVYLLDRSFRISPEGSTRMDLARAYLHELAHVAQFLSLEPSYVRAALDGEVESVRVVEGSSLVRDFARAVGWVDSSDDPLRPRWSLREGEPPTPHGASRPDEDMADTVALVAIGRPGWVSEARVSWVEEWLGVDAATLAAGKPWAPPGSSEVLSVRPIYDPARVEAAAGERPHAEPLYFLLPPGVAGPAELADEVNRRLAERRLSGMLEPVDDPRLPRFAGLFTRRDGLAYWVELWDFRRASGFADSPGHPVLAYVVLW